MDQLDLEVEALAEALEPVTVVRVIVLVVLD